MPLLVEGRAVAVQKNSFCALITMLLGGNCTAFVEQCHSYCTIELPCLCARGLRWCRKRFLIGIEKEINEREWRRFEKEKEVRMKVEKIGAVPEMGRDKIEMEKFFY